MRPPHARGRSRIVRGPAPVSRPPKHPGTPFASPLPDPQLPHPTTQRFHMPRPRRLSLFFAMLLGTFLPATADVTLECPAEPNSVGPGAHLRWIGPFAPDQGRLWATRLPAHTPTWVFYSSQPDNAPFGNGRLCMAPAFIMARQQSDANGEVLFHIGDEGEPEDQRYLLWLSRMGVDTWYFQLGYRDVAGGGAGYNTTDGIRVVFD